MVRIDISGQTFEKGPRGLEPFFRTVAVEPFLARPRKLTPLSERLMLALPDSGIGERDRVELGSTASCKANVYQCRCALLKCLSRIMREKKMLFFLVDRDRMMPSEKVYKNR